VQTKVSVGKEDNGKSIHLGVGDILEVNLSEMSARAAWQMEVDAEVLAPISSPINTQTVYVLDATDQMYQRSFRATRVGRAVLKMSYNSVDDGTPMDSFALEAIVGDAPKAKPMRQTLPASQLVIILVEWFLVAVAGALISFRQATLVATAMKEATTMHVGEADLLIALFGTVGMAIVAGFLLLRIVSFFVARLR